MKRILRFIMTVLTLVILCNQYVVTVKAEGTTEISNFQIKSENNSNSHREAIEFDYKSIGYQAGESFNVDLQSPLFFIPIAPFPLLTSDGKSVGTCTVTKTQMKCTFNENVQPVMNGHIQVWSSFYVEPTESNQEVPVTVIVAGTTYTHNVPVTGVGVVTDPLVKYSSMNGDLIDYTVQLNLTKKTYTNAIFTDEPDGNTRVRLETIRINHVALSEFGTVIPGTQTDVTNNYTPKMQGDGFYIDFGNSITSKDQYSITYQSEITNDTAKIFNNVGKLTANEIQLYTYYNQIEKSEGSGTATGDGAGIEIYKQDVNTKALLAGAEFEVQDSAGKVVAKIQTNENGVAKTPKTLYFGKYKLIETKAPKGYVLDPTPKVVDINRNTPNYTAIETFDNVRAVGQIEITKQDKATQAKLVGAEFDVKDEKGTVVDHIVTADTGVALSKELPLGTYTLTETKAPKGYELDTTPITVTIQTHKEVVKQTIHNIQSVGQIEITKQDKATQTKLVGAEFDVKDEKGTVVDHIVTADTGVALSKELPLGTYTFTETKAPKGYELDTTPITVTIQTHKEVVKQTITNQKIVEVTPKVEIPQTEKPEIYESLPDTGSNKYVVLWYFNVFFIVVLSSFVTLYKKLTR